MSTTNTTHRKTLARALSSETGEPYAAALARVTAASEAGLLPARLDDDGLAEALRVLTAADAPRISVPSTAEMALSPADADYAPVRRTASDPRDQPIWDASFEYETLTGNQGLLYITSPGGKADKYVFGGSHDELGGSHTALGRDEAHKHIAHLVEQAKARAAQQASQPAATPAPEQAPTRIDTPRFAHTEDRCTASSWRDNPGRRGERIYGPGGYNRCVRREGHDAYDHIDEWGNRFRLEPSFKVLGHAEKEEVVKAATIAGTLDETGGRHYLLPAVLRLLRQVWQGRVAFQRGSRDQWSFTVDEKPASDIVDLHLRWLADNDYIATADLTPGDEWAVARTTGFGDEVLAANGADVDRFHDGLPSERKKDPAATAATQEGTDGLPRVNTLWVTADAEMVRVSTIYGPDRISAQVLMPPPPRTTVRFYTAAEVAAWSEPTDAQVEDYDKAWSVNG